eukprot:7743667-Heterocapsa_arctica.AAC.1
MRRFDAGSPPVAPGDTVSAKALLRAWGVDSAAADLPVLLLPFPIAYVVSVRGWDNLLLKAAWHQSFNMFKPGCRHFPSSPGPVPGWPPDCAPVWA